MEVEIIKHVAPRGQDTTGHQRRGHAGGDGNRAAEPGGQCDVGGGGGSWVGGVAT